MTEPETEQSVTIETPPVDEAAAPLDDATPLDEAAAPLDDAAPVDAADPVDSVAAPSPDAGNEIARNVDVVGTETGATDDDTAVDATLHDVLAEDAAETEVAPSDGNGGTRDEAVESPDVEATAPTGEISEGATDEATESELEPRIAAAEEAADADDETIIGDAASTAGPMLFDEPPPAAAAMPAAPVTAPVRVPVATATAGPAQPRRSRKLLISLISLGVLAAVIGGACGSVAAWQKNKRLASGLSIEGIDVGGMTMAQARQALHQRFGEPKLEVKAPDEAYEAPIKEMGGTLEIDRVLNDAYWLGRSGPFWQDAWRLVNVHQQKRALSLSIKWNRPVLQRELHALAKKYHAAPQNALLKVTSTGVLVVGEKAGRNLNVEATRRDVESRYSTSNTHIAATVTSVQPRITSASLAGADVKLGEYRTYFNSGLIGRTRNINIASDIINGTVLMPGETFSFNRLTGERTWEKGYRMAHIFERKPGKEQAEVVDGLAGGVCQVSTTLYNAVRRANNKFDGKLRIVERNFHSLPVTYVPSGLDATVAWPHRDFRFANKFTFPIYVRTSIDGERLVVSTWARAPLSVASSMVTPTPTPTPPAAAVVPGTKGLSRIAAGG